MREIVIYKGRKEGIYDGQNGHKMLTTLLSLWWSRPSEKAVFVTYSKKCCTVMLCGGLSTHNTSTF